MLIKNTDAASASTDTKTARERKVDEASQPKHVVSPTVVIHEPQPDWVSLASAPLRYDSYGYIRSVEKWGENLGVKVKQFSTSFWARDDDDSKPEYSFAPKKPGRFGSRRGK
jgi:hypothetical protein